MAGPISDVRVPGECESCEDEDEDVSMEKSHQKAAACDGPPFDRPDGDVAFDPPEQHSDQDSHSAERTSPSGYLAGTEYEGVGSITKIETRVASFRDTLEGFQRKASLQKKIQPEIRGFGVRCDSRKSDTRMQKSGSVQNYSSNPSEVTDLVLALQERNTALETEATKLKRALREAKTKSSQIQTLKATLHSTEEEKCRLSREVARINSEAKTACDKVMKQNSDMRRNIIFLQRQEKELRYQLRDRKSGGSGILTSTGSLEAACVPSRLPSNEQEGSEQKSSSLELELADLRPADEANVGVPNVVSSSVLQDTLSSATCSLAAQKKDLERETAAISRRNLASLVQLNESHATQSELILALQAENLRLGAALQLSGQANPGRLVKRRHSAPDRAAPGHWGGAAALRSEVRLPDPRAGETRRMEMAVEAERCRLVEQRYWATDDKMLSGSALHRKLRRKLDLVTAERAAALQLVIKYKSSLRDVRAALACHTSAKTDPSRGVGETALGT